MLFKPFTNDGKFGLKFLRVDENDPQQQDSLRLLNVHALSNKDDNPIVAKNGVYCIEE